MTDNHVDVAKERYGNFSEFYAQYLLDHQNPVNRKYHFLGTGGALLLLAAYICSGKAILLLTAVICGYAFAWYGHFQVEGNRPRSFRQPVYSLLADFRMFWSLLSMELSMR